MNMFNQVKGLASAYSLNINSVAEINKKIKFQAKNYYEKYKEIQANFDKERRELRSKKTLLDYELNINNEENSKLKTLYNEVKTELLFFRARLGVKIENDPPKGPYMYLNLDEDFVALSRLLKESNEDLETEGLEDQEISNLVYDSITQKRILDFYNLKEFSEKKEENAQNVYSKKSETVHFSDNEDNNDILNNQSNREEINVLVSENVLLFNKINKSKEIIKYNHLKDDEYEFNGVSIRLSVIDNQVLGILLIKPVLDKQNNWISLLEFLSTTFPLVTTGSSAGSNKKQKLNINNSKNNSSIQSQLDKIKEEKQKLLSSMNNHSQSAISRSKSPILVNQKKLSSN